MSKVKIWVPVRNWLGPELKDSKVWCCLIKSPNITHKLARRTYAATALNPGDRRGHSSNSFDCLEFFIPYQHGTGQLPLQTSVMNLGQAHYDDSCSLKQKVKRKEVQTIKVGFLGILIWTCSETAWFWHRPDVIESQGLQDDTTPANAGSRLPQ